MLFQDMLFDVHWVARAVTYWAGTTYWSRFSRRWLPPPQLYLFSILGSHRCPTSLCPDCLCPFLSTCGARILGREQSPGTYVQTDWPRGPEIVMAGGNLLCPL
ncbi:hypothetical protein PoB_000182000 [Plakobranchus ocellatus]|uniref:Uncharacterized protein n=1 Tax=Plakobranchus ocellatus TaxID=259542 RepID=A0AAV3XXG0_9GAST|nr:hypothetical protein PoB_000182000 [Plakobranchus ocellatus]